MRIVHISAEFAPLAKAGGMGEVLVGLCRELTQLGHETEIILPKYDFIDLKTLNQVKLELADFKCWESGQLHANAMWYAETEGCRLHLLEARHPAGYFHRGKIYGCEDDTRRFIYFCRAVLEYLKLGNREIDILHLHDWHTALCAVLARDLFQLPIKAIVLTLHNMEYQGHCASWDLDAIGLNGQKYLHKDKMQDPRFSEAINLLKGGLVYADALVAVSPTYAREIVTPEGGFYLDQTLRKMKSKLTGILNGIDHHLWNPAADPCLAAHFSEKSPIGTILTSKQKMRESLAKQWGLDPNKRPWVGAITRLVNQKGPELLEAAIEQVPAMGATFLLLGASPNPKIQKHFDALKKKFHGNAQVLLQFEYNERLAHQLYSALDFILIPSTFEPCGLTQMIGMRYGAIPIARATGGLKDTVFDAETSEKKRNGFLFSEMSPRAIHDVMKRAFAHFHKDGPAFEALIQHAVQLDCSWKAPSQHYVQLYRRLIAKPI
ncbi:MAG: glycogen synthase [Chlamydiia bacterium]|nr:glycogen synthase [Chlamydiia bacterium]